MGVPVQRELRLALGMRGGVSLAVWIGGACREMDGMRRSTLEQTESPELRYWEQLLRFAGYDRAVIDVMAGASAGGLNAVISAASQIYGFPLDNLRDAWLGLADIGKMVRPPGKESPSLLMGDEFFLANVRTNLENFINEGNSTAPTVARRVDITLTATLVQPIVRRVRRLEADSQELRSASLFRFRHGARAGESSFPAPGADELASAVDQLAMAARATSSFPVAFEAASVFAPRPPSFSEAGPAEGPRGEVSMAGVFADAGPHPFAVLDGGALDNIPLGRALSALVDAPAEGPTQRVLVYVDPNGPPSRQDPAPADPDRPRRSTWAVVEGAVRTRVQSETIGADIRQVEEHNRRVRRAGSLYVGALADVMAGNMAVLAGAPAPELTPAQRRDAYLRARADADAQAVARLLDDPIALLGEDPFPAIESDDTWRHPLDRWDQTDRFGLDTALLAAFGTSLRAGGTVRRGVGPVARLAALLASACRWVEDTTADADVRAEAGKAKRRLYRVVEVHRQLIERPQRLGWVVRAAACKPAKGDVSAWATATVAALDRLRRLDKLEAAAFEAYVLDDDSRGLADVRARLCRVLDELATGALAEGAPEPEDRDAGDVLAAAVLVPTARWLGELRSPAAVGGEEPGDVDPAPLLLHLLAGSDPDGALDQVEMRTFQASQVGPMGARDVDMVRLTAATPTPLSRYFETLRARDPKLSPGTKLAGNELFNFAAFLRRHWRANDWMWGRVDAVPTLVQLTVTWDGLVGAAARVLESTAPERAEAELMLDLRQLARAAFPRDEAWHKFLADEVWTSRASAQISTAVTAAVAAARDPDATPAEDEREPLLRPLWDALVAARQWTILAEELPRVRLPEGVDPPGSATPDVVKGLARTYDVGLETMRKPKVPSDKDLVDKLVPAAFGVLTTDAPAYIPRGVVAVLRRVPAVWRARRWLLRLTAVLAAMRILGRRRRSRT